MRLIAFFAVWLTALWVSAQAPLTVDNLADTSTASLQTWFRVPSTTGYSYRVLLNGRALPTDTTNWVANPDYHELAIWRTNLATGSVTNRLVRFIVLSERGAPETGLIPWTPFPLIPSTAAEANGAHLELTMPAAYPADLPIPVVAWVRNALGEARRINGRITAPGFADKDIPVFRGTGSGLLPAATNSGTLDYQGTLAGLGDHHQVEIEGNTVWVPKSGVLTMDETWPNNSRIALTGSLTVPSNLVLTVGAGTVIKLLPLVNLTNSGRLLIQGTASQPVIFTATNIVWPENNAGAWGGLVMRGDSAWLEANHTIFTGGGGAKSWSFSPGGSHRSEQAVLFVHSGAHAFLTNCAIIHTAGQVGNAYNSELVLDHTLCQKAITCGEYVGGVVTLNHSAVIEFPSDDGVVNGTIADADYDGIYFTTGTHVLMNSLFGFAKDDAIDSGSGGAGTMYVTNCWVESALHEAHAWSGQGRVARSYDTVLMNSGQGIENGWTESANAAPITTSPDCFAERLLSTANSVGARTGDNYNWSYQGFLRLTNSLILHNYRDIFARTWNTVGQGWDTNRWVDRLAQMDLRSNLLTTADTRFPANQAWDPARDAGQLAHWMTTPPAAPVGIGLALRTNRFSLGQLFEGVPVRLSSFTTNWVTVDYRFSDAATQTLTTGTLTFAPGETVKRIFPTGFNLADQNRVSVQLANPVRGEVTGLTEAIYAGTVPAPQATLRNPSLLNLYRLPEGVPISLTAPSTEPVTVRYRLEAGALRLQEGEVVFVPGETLAWIPGPTGPVDPAWGLVRLGLLPGTWASLTGATNLFALPYPAATESTGITLLPRGGGWKYLDTGTNLGSGWIATNYDDSAWPAGRTIFGYDNAGIESTTNSFGTNSGAKFITTYFRTTLVATNPAALTSLTFSLRRDDGAAVYFNGAELYRENLTNAALTHTTRSLTNVSGTATIYSTRTFDLAALPRPLVAGTNYLAVEIHQSSPTSSDMIFDFDVIGNPPPATTARPQIHWGMFDRARLQLGWTDPTWQMETAGQLAGPWTTNGPATGLAEFSPTNGQQYFRLRR